MVRNYLSRAIAPDDVFESALPRLFIAINTQANFGHAFVGQGGMGQVKATCADISNRSNTVAPAKYARVLRMHRTDADGFQNHGY